MHSSKSFLFDVQGNKEYDLEVLEFLRGMMDPNWLLNLEKTEIFLGIHHKHKYEIHYTRQMHIINNDLYTSYEI